MLAGSPNAVGYSGIFATYVGHLLHPPLGVSVVAVSGLTRPTTTLNRGLIRIISKTLLYVK